MSISGVSVAWFAFWKPTPEDRVIEVQEWNRDVRVPQFVRWATHDLKLSTSKRACSQSLMPRSRSSNGWPLSGTAVSNLLRAVRDLMREQGDPLLDAITFGIAR